MFVRYKKHHRMWGSSLKCEVKIDRILGKITKTTKIAKTKKDLKIVYTIKGYHKSGGLYWI